MSDSVPSKRVSETVVELAQIMEPNDANFLGKVFGGSLLAAVDLCAYAASSKFAGTVCVTASFDRVDFLQPINVGELVTLIGHISYAGRTSVEVTIEVHADNLLTGEKRHTNTARVTMVAIDPETKKPTPVPKLICETREEKIQFLEGRLRREIRVKHRAERDAIAARYRELSEEELDFLMTAQSLV